MKKGKMKILGICFSANKEASLIEDNWNDKIENTLRMINSWGKRNPTLYGKAILAKTLMLSQFSYALQALAYPETTLKKINTMIHRFLWKRKYNNKKAFEKIKRNVLSLPIAEGGLNMINIEHQQNMFQSTVHIFGRTHCGTECRCNPQRAERYRNNYKSLLEADTKNGYVSESQQGSPTTSARTAMEQS